MRLLMMVRFGTEGTNPRCNGAGYGSAGDYGTAAKQNPPSRT